MAVDEVAGPVALHQGEEGLEPLVGWIRVIVDPPRGSVGEEDVQPPAPELGPPQPPGEPLHPPPHLPLRVLVRPARRVAWAPPEAGDEEPRRLHHAALHVRPPLRGRDEAALGFYRMIVVPVDVEEGGIERIHEVLKVIVGEVATGQDEVEFAEPPSGEGSLQGRANLIAHDEDPCHVPARSSSPSDRSFAADRPSFVHPRRR